MPREPKNPKRPTMGDAGRIVPDEEDHVENVGQRRPDAEGGDDVIVNHPNDRENEREDNRANERDANGEGYETERSGAV